MGSTTQKAVTISPTNPKSFTRRDISVSSENIVKEHQAIPASTGTEEYSRISEGMELTAPQQVVDSKKTELRSHYHELLIELLQGDVRKLMHLDSLTRKNLDETGVIIKKTVQVMQIEKQLGPEQKMLLLKTFLWKLFMH